LNHIKVEAKARGSVVKVIGIYKEFSRVNIWEVTAKAKGSFTKIIKGCEAYLVANPDAYN
jgi:hypothetical protein